jgi:hypothetical protein
MVPKGRPNGERIGSFHVDRGHDIAEEVNIANARFSAKARNTVPLLIKTLDLALTHIDCAPHGDDCGEKATNGGVPCNCWKVDAEKELNAYLDHIETQSK